MKGLGSAFQCSAQVVMAWERSWTLVKVPHKTCKHVAHRLTFKVAGKTRAVYVPLDRVKDVEAWTKEYRRLKRLIRSVTKASLGELRNHVKSRRASAGGRKSPVRTRPA